MTKGRFITFEGGEGTGKSTQALLLADFLRQQDISVVVTREPGGSAGAELIRALLVSGEVNRWTPISEVLLFNAARVDHWEKIIFPALQQGQWVICDRFADSTIVYQGFGHGLDRQFLMNLHKSVLPHALPNRTYVFDLEPEIGIQRALNRHTGENRFENMKLDFHHKMRQGYLEIALNNPERCKLIDATQSVTAIYEEITKDILPLASSYSAPASYWN